MAQKKIKVDIISGFLGAGKTTLIKKLVSETLKDEKVAIIENEFGEIGVDGDFLKDAGIEIKEINSGCICCSLVGDFTTALKEMIDIYSPDRIIIEPSGVGKLSDVIKSVKKLEDEGVVINSASVVVDAGKAKMYTKNFGEFFDNQIKSAGTVILSRTQNVDDGKVMDSAEIINNLNEYAKIVINNWTDITAEKLLEAMESSRDKIDMLIDMLENPEHHYHDHGDGNFHFHDHEESAEEEDDHDHEHHHHDDDEHEHEHHHHHHHHHDKDEHEHEHHHHDDDEHEHEHHHHHHHDEDEHEHEHHHHHDEDEHEHKHHHHHHDEDEHEHEHHHHHHDEDEHEHEHHHHDHHHHHDDNCTCGSHDHHHHDADEVFESWGIVKETELTKDELTKILEALANETHYGVIVRAKGIVADHEGKNWQFDLTPGEFEIRQAADKGECKVCVIGQELDSTKLEELFKLN